MERAGLWRRAWPQLGTALLIVAMAGASALGAEVPLPPERPGGAGVTRQTGQETPPLPPAKPAEVAPAMEAPSAKGKMPAKGSEPEIAKPEIAKPEPARPAPAEPDKAGTSPTEGTAPPAPEGAAPQAGAGDTNIVLTEEQACEERLRDLGVGFSPVPPIQEGACVVPAPLMVRSLSPTIALTAPTTMNCPATEALARWATVVVAPAVRSELKADLTGLSANGYQCRTRNHDPAEKISEHALANAVDLSDLEIAGQPRLVIGSVEPGDAPRHRVEDAARRGACRYFETVLGPGADPEHANHLHVDRRQRSNGFRICE